MLGIIYYIKESCNDYKTFFSNPYIFEILRRKPLIFQALNLGPNIIHSLKYQRSTTSGCNAIGIRTLVFAIIAQLLCRCEC